MAERVPQSVAYLWVFRAFLASDGKTPATGKTIAITISKNGGAFGNPAAGALNATEISSGFYKAALGTGDADTLGPLALRGAEGTINDAGDVLSVVKATNAGFSALPDVAAEGAGGLYTRGTGAGQIAQDANGNVRVNVDTIKTNPVVNAGTVTYPTGATLASTTNITAGTITTATNVTTVNGLAAGVITATSIAADAITDAKVAADVTIASVTGAVGSVTGAVGSVTGNVGGNVTGSVGSVATGGITAASFAANAITAAKLDPDVTTELQAGLATSVEIAALPTAVENADALMQRDSSNWEASAPLKSLGVAVMKAVHKIAPTGSDLIIYRSDGTTAHAKQALTTDATLEPIKDVGAAITP